MAIKHQMKAILVTQDGEIFLVLREFYTNDLSTGKLLDGKYYQGRTLKLVKEIDDEKQLLQEKG